MKNPVPLYDRLMQSSSVNAWIILLTPALCFLMAKGFVAANLPIDFLGLKEWLNTEAVISATFVALLIAIPAYLMHTLFFDNIALLNRCGLKQVKNALWLDGGITLLITGSITLASIGSKPFLPPMLMLLVALPFGQLFRYGWLTSLTSNDTQALDRFIILSYRIAKVIPLVIFGAFILMILLIKLFG